MWQNNLLNFLLVAAILIALFIIIYCRVTNKTLLEVIKDLKG
jgi:uncharacterized membrane protein YjfL (UPF0719 family)